MADKDLAIRIVNDHDKLDRIFSDLEQTLDALAAGGAGEDRDFIEDTRADLSFALEEMLEHFGIEEEAIFQQIRMAIPDLGARLDRLEKCHESLCNQTTRLRKMVAAAGAGASELSIPEVLTLVQRVRTTLSQHNRDEVQVFLEALERLDEAGQKRLREDLDRL